MDEEIEIRETEIVHDAARRMTTCLTPEKKFATQECTYNTMD